MFFVCRPLYDKQNDIILSELCVSAVKKISILRLKKSKGAI